MSLFYQPDVITFDVESGAGLPADIGIYGTSKRILYWEMVLGSDFNFYIYTDEARTQLIAQVEGAAVAGNRVLVAMNGSGVTGYINAAVGDDALGRLYLNYSSLQAQLPRFDVPPQLATLADVENAVTDNNQGTNYRIQDGELQLLNTDQNEYTPINTVGADGAQQIELHDTEA